MRFMRSKTRLGWSLQVTNEAFFGSPYSAHAIAARSPAPGRSPAGFEIPTHPLLPPRPVRPGPGVSLRFPFLHFSFSCVIFCTFCASLLLYYIFVSPARCRNIILSKTMFGALQTEQCKSYCASLMCL